MSAEHPNASLPVFVGIDAPGVDVLLRTFRRRNAAEGEWILSEDETTQELFCVLSGGVEVLRNTPAGPRNIAIVKPGYCFGEVGFFAGEPRTASVRAVAPTELLSMQQADLHRLIEEHPRIAALFLRNLLAVVTGRFAEMHTQLAQIVFWLGA